MPLYISLHCLTIRAPPYPVQTLVLTLKAPYDYLLPALPHILVPNLQSSSIPLLYQSERIATFSLPGCSLGLSAPQQVHNTHTPNIGVVPPPSPLDGQEDFDMLN